MKRRLRLPLDFSLRFARIEGANDTGRDMAKRKIQELTTGVHDFPTLIKDKDAKHMGKTDILHGPGRRGVDDKLVEEA